MKKIICALLLISILFSTALTGCNRLIDELLGSGNSSSGGSGGVIGGISFGKTPTYKVKFQTNGGTEIETQYLSEIDKAPLTTKNEYKFDGWFLDATLTSAAIFPLTVDKDITLYARWVRIEYSFTCNSSQIKYMDSDYNSTVTYNISPYGFDYDRLAELEADGLNLTVTYTVYYRKTYNGIGYAGSPKYEASIQNSENRGRFLKDLTTSTTSETRTISVASTFDYFSNDDITLKFSTNNIQNVIYIGNITVKYEWCKLNN